MLKIAIDKLEHFFYGMIGFTFLVPFIGINYSAIVSCIWWIGREVKSKITGKGQSEILDAVFSLLGVAYVYFILATKNLYLLSKISNYER